MGLNSVFISGFCGSEIEVDWRDGDREGKQADCKCLSHPSSSIEESQEAAPSCIVACGHRCAAGQSRGRTGTLHGSLMQTYFSFSCIDSYPQSFVFTHVIG